MGAYLQVAHVLLVLTCSRTVAKAGCKMLLNGHSLEAW